MVAPRDLVLYIAKKCKKQHIIVFLFTFFTGVFLYIRMMTQLLANPDAVWEGLVFKKSYAWEWSLGRFGLETVNKVKGFFQYPSFQVAACIAGVAFIAVLLSELFQIKSVWVSCIIGIILVVSPSFCSVLTYYYTSDAMILAYLAVVVAVLLLARKNGPVWLLASSVLIACSLSLYQAYIGTAVTLCLLYLMYLLFCKGEPWKRILCLGCRFMAGGFLGAAGYYAAFRILCIVKHVAPVSDRGFDNMGGAVLASLPGAAGRAYTSFYDYFLTDNLFNNSWRLRGKANFVVFVLLLVTLLLLVWQKQLYLKWKEMLAAVLLTALLPAAFMSIVILAPEASIYEVTGILMLPHMNLLYLFLIITAFSCADNIPGAAVQWGTLIICGWIVLTLGMYTQVFQNCMEQDLNRSYALAQRMVSQVEDLPEYRPGMKLMVGGRAENGNYPRNFEEMYYIVKGTAASYGFFWDSSNGRQNCWNNFLRQYLGVQYSTCSGEELAHIEASEEYADMPIFPLEGSVKMMGETAVVKLGN